jgi:hypothetical protein
LQGRVGGVAVDKVGGLLPLHSDIHGLHNRTCVTNSGYEAFELIYKLCAWEKGHI